MNKIIENIIRLKNDSGPWGPFKGGNNSGKPNKPQTDSELDDLIKKSQDFVKKIFGEEDKSRNFGGGKNNITGGKTPKSLVGMIVLGAIILWLSTGIYKVDPDENALVLYLGKYHSIATPGLNYHIPAPFGKAIKKSVTTVNTEEFGFHSAGKFSKKSSANDTENLMLTGDENIVDIDFQVQWQISDIKDFVFNINDPNLAVKKASESAMREVIARTPIADALSDGKKRIEDETKTSLQAILDSYHAGVRIVLVQLRRVDPPHQVIDAFRDVQTAKADKEKEINQAEAYRNDIIPRARGAVAQLQGQAEAYKQEVVANAQGQTNRFLAIYNQYSKAKSITKKRMYLETMEKLYKDTDKIIIDKNASKGLVPYLPINELKNVKKEKE